jgi:hypothetical protein
VYFQSYLPMFQLLPKKSINIYYVFELFRCIVHVKTMTLQERFNPIFCVFYCNTPPPIPPATLPPVAMNPVDDLNTLIYAGDHMLVILFTKLTHINFRRAS